MEHCKIQRPLTHASLNWWAHADSCRPCFTHLLRCERARAEHWRARLCSCQYNKLARTLQHIRKHKSFYRLLAHTANLRISNANACGSLLSECGLPIALPLVTWQHQVARVDVKNGRLLVTFVLHQVNGQLAVDILWLLCWEKDASVLGALVAPVVP